jgi:hypothetical protein
MKAFEMFESVVNYPVSYRECLETALTTLESLDHGKLSLSQRLE